MRLLRAEQVRELDRRAIEEFGMPGMLLMENAGRGATDCLLRTLSARSPSCENDEVTSYRKRDSFGPVAIFTGAGNNGGDGYVMARHLLNRGIETWVFLTTPPEQVTGDAKTQLHILEKMAPDALIPCWESDALSSVWKERLSHASAIVDALLGTGLTRDVSGCFLQRIRYLNGVSGPLKFAVDVPSGLDADWGHPRPECFVADKTATFAFAKVGMWMPKASSYVGDIEVIDIGMPHVLADTVEPVAEVLEEQQLRGQWPRRALNSHKGTFGHVLVVAGSRGKSGAALLSCMGALRSGVGFCTLASEPSVARQVEGKLFEVMCEPIEGLAESSNGVETRKDGLHAWPSLHRLLERKDALVLGPGLSQRKYRDALVHVLLEGCRLPTVVDADGLNLLAENLDVLRRRKGPTVLTPHPGEMARLFNTTTKYIQENRAEVALSFARDYGVIVVLKGARTLIAAPFGQLWINPTGNPGLATAGSGDVLAGMIGSLLAQGHTPARAACLGVFLHGLAGDRCLQRCGQAGLIASELFVELGAIFAEWEGFRKVGGSNSGFGR